jgi:hypothetical protein
MQPVDARTSVAQRHRTYVYLLYPSHIVSSSGYRPFIAKKLACSQTR